VPSRAVFLIAAVTLVLGLALVDNLELLTSMISFGALLGFLLLHLSVIAHFIWHEGSRNWLRHLVAPGAGLVVIAYVLANAEANAKIAGSLWLLAGLGVYVALKVLKRPVTLPD
jgi:amino acid transporter